MAGGLHSYGFDSHHSFGVHQEPFHGFDLTHHDRHHSFFHYDSHHDDHFYFRPFVRYASYPRYGYSGGGHGTYVAPTVLVTRTQPVVIDTEERVEGSEGAPAEVPREGAASPRDEHGTSGPARLRAPLIETREAPEVLPPLPGGLKRQ